MTDDVTFIRIRLKDGSVDTPGDLRAVKKALETASEARNPWLHYGGVVFHVGRVVVIEDSTDLVRRQVQNGKAANAAMRALMPAIGTEQWDALLESLPPEAATVLGQSVEAYTQARNGGGASE